MPERRRGLLAALAGAALLATPSPAPADGADYARFDDWDAACITPAAGYCRASAEADGAGALARFRLRVNLPGFFADTVVSFVAVDQLLAPDTDVVFGIDGGAALRFVAGDDWQPLGALNDYYLVAGRSAALLAALRGATAVEVGYRDITGEQRRQNVSLRGLDAALAHVERQRDAALPGFARHAAGGWARHLHELLPAMEACLAVAPAEPAVVTGASTLDTGLAHVQLLADGGRRHACVVELDTLALRESRPVRDTAADDAGPWYLPARHRPPRDACRGQLMVVDAADRLRGWLLYGC